MDILYPRFSVKDFKNLNLGCPNLCLNFLCVDLHPRNPFVVKCDAIKFLKYTRLKNHKFERIRAYNLIEHLKNPRLFIFLCYINLKNNGILELKTDNAWNPIHYIKNPLHILTGSHTDENYKYVFTKAKHTPHYYIFTKMHLRNLLSPYFNIKIMKYTTFFSRIYVLAQKNDNLKLKANRKLELKQKVEVNNDTFSEILL